MNSSIAIVDPYSSGSLLSPICKEKGYSCIAIHSAPELPIVCAASFQKEDFEFEKFYSNESEQELLNFLKSNNCVAIIAGAEMGVTLADKLAYKMGLNHNDYSLIDARRNKFLMQKALKNNNIRSINSFLVKNIDELTKLEAELIFPVIIKPINSGGSDNVHLCYSMRELLDIFGRIINEKNDMGFINNQVIIQDYIEGPEYVVDSVSCQGSHYTTNIFKYTKIRANNSSVVYRRIELMTTPSQVTHALILYNNNVLNSLGIKFGPSHSEIIFTETGPVLVETGARLHGAYVPSYVSTVSESSQLDLTSEAFTAHEEFFLATKCKPTFNKNLTVHFLVSYQEGILKDICFKDDIESLDSFHTMVFSVSVGGSIKKTVSLNSCPGWVVLIHKDISVIEDDIKKIEEWEKKGLFII